MGSKPSKPKPPPEPLRKVDANMQEARNDAAKRQQAAAGFQAANITKGNTSKVKLGGGGNLAGGE
jgi:hypothetical protein